MTVPKDKPKIEVPIREPKKKTPGIFDNLRKLPQPHPVEEILGLTPSPVESELERRTPPTPDTPPTTRTSATARTARTARTPRRSATVAPDRDYTKVANSILREAVAGGYFTGKSKQLYDFLYYRTRGAIVATRSVRITKPRLMAGSGIGSERTLLKNLAHLKATGLVQVKVTDGEHGGNEYTIFLPEEVDLAEPTPRTSPTPPILDDERHAPQERGVVPSVESGVRGVGLYPTETITSEESQTSSLRPPENTFDDDDAALAGLVATLSKATKEITGRELSQAESDRWRELGELLVTELKIAAARTNVSSVPSFFTEHLRRRLWKKDKNQLRMESEQTSNSSTSQPQSAAKIKNCPDCGGSGMYYPQGYEKGVARCKHENLKSSPTDE